MSIDELPTMRVKLKAFAGNKAVLVTNDKQELKWPAHMLPDNAAIGSDIELQLITSQHKETYKTDLAKTILNELLTTHGNAE